MKNNDTSEQANVLSGLLPIRQRELLRILAEQDGRTEFYELLWLIEARAVGRLRDIGDGQAAPIVPPELHPRSLGQSHGIVFERVPDRSDAAKNPRLPQT